MLIKIEDIFYDESLTISKNSDQQAAAAYCPDWPAALTVSVSVLSLSLTSHPALVKTSDEPAEIRELCGSLSVSL